MFCLLKAWNRESIYSSVVILNKSLKLFVSVPCRELCLLLLFGVVSLYQITKWFELTQQKVLLNYDCTANAFTLFKIILQVEMQSNLCPFWGAKGGVWK